MVALAACDDVRVYGSMISQQVVVRTIGLTKVFKDFWRRDKVVAVKDLDPATEEAMMLAMAECSDSTLMNLASISPSAHNRDNSSTIVVWGVMG